MKKLAIITGTSRGLGKSFAKYFLENDYRVIGLSRSGGDINHKNYSDLICDLSNIESIEHVFAKIKSGVRFDTFDEIVLINNAGQLGPIGPVGKADVEVAFQNIAVNVSGLIAFTGLLVKDIQNINCKKYIMHISSGAAKNPYFGWSAYCSSKAAVEMFNACLAVEQENQEFPIKTIAFAPGVLDTAMQEQIRNTDEKNFIHKQKFVDLKENNELLNTEEVVVRLVGYLQSELSESGHRYDIRELEAEI